MPEQGRNLVYESGPWQVHLARRELLTGGVAVPIGARAFEIVEILVQSANELITKDDLMGRVWPGAAVGENTIQVHISAIRKALGRDRAMLKTASGRGYRLLGQWTARASSASPVPAASTRVRTAVQPIRSNLPLAAVELIGREAALGHLRDLSSAYRIVTLTGPGGIGKTSLALQFAREMVLAFNGDVWLIEFASLPDASLVAVATANALGLQLSGTDISPDALARMIGGRRLLLLFDNCEHIIDAVACVVETLARRCPAVSILVTSREHMRIEGEGTYRVHPLEFPLPGSAGRIGSVANEDDILQASAVQLFIARLTAWQSDLQHQNQQELLAIAAICRRLDGIPLAIEFAAARAATLGLEEVLSRLDDRFALLTTGRRTALAKHRTLRATLDWSHGLLTDQERLILRRLGIFADGFFLEAATTVIKSSEVTAKAVADGVLNLVAKSLVTADNADGFASFRLLETTRAYALEKLAECNELQQFARGHAEYYRDLLARKLADQETASVRLPDIRNARSALEWCFGADGDSRIGVGLAAAAAPVFLAISVLTECHRWSKRAIPALDEATRGGAEEMHLQASLGVSSMYLHGESDMARAALSRSLAIAQAHGHVLLQVELLSTLSMFHTRDGDFKTALHYAQLSRTAAGAIENAAAMALIHCRLGRSLHFMGDHAGARAELEASLRHWSRSADTETNIGADHRILAGIGLARTLWLQGFPAQAVDRTRWTIEESRRRNNPGSIGLALAWAPGIFLWTGDLQRAEDHADMLISHAESHSLAPYLALGRAYKGVLRIRRGDAGSGVDHLRDCLRALHAARYEMANTEFRLCLIEGLVATGQFDEGMSLVDRTIGLVEANGDLFYMPEALRVKGSAILAMSRHRTDDAEACFTQSLDWSRRQGARAWELRTAIDLATLWVEQGRDEDARTLLRQVFESIAEGSDTADVQAAERLLASLVR